MHCTFGTPKSRADSFSSLKRCQVCDFNGVHQCIISQTGKLPQKQNKHDDDDDAAPPPKRKVVSPPLVSEYVPPPTEAKRISAFAVNAKPTTTPSAAAGPAVAPVVKVPIKAFRSGGVRPFQTQAVVKVKK